MKSVLISVGIILFSFAFLSSSLADETKTVFVGPILVDCIGVSPQKCMLVKEDLNSKYSNFYDKIEKFEFEEGYNYKIVIKVTDVENPPADSSSKKYKLIEVLEKNSTKFHKPYQNMCAPGFELLGNICMLNDICSSEIYPGKICIANGNNHPYLRPHQQRIVGISSEEIICSENLQLIFKHNAVPACVKPSSIKKLEMRGWLLEKPLIPCTLDWNPVCGYDGKTYGNLCLIKETEMEVKHEGECVILTEFELDEKYQNVQKRISKISGEIYNGMYNGDIPLDEALKKLEESKIDLLTIKEQYDNLENTSKTDRQIAMRFLTLGKMGFASLDSQINIIKNQIRSSSE